MAIYALDYVAANAQRGSFSDAAMVMDSASTTTLVFSIDLTTKADTFHYIISTDTGLTTSNVNIYYSQSSGNLAINMGSNLFYSMPADFEDAGARYFIVWEKQADPGFNVVYIVKQDGVSSATSVGSFTDSESIPGTRTWQVANRQDNTAARYANAEVGMLAKFDRALTTQEMEDLAHYVVEAKDLTNCAIYYPYSEGSGTTATDTQQGAVFTTVNNPGWVLLDGGGEVTVTGQTTSASYVAVNSTVSLTGVVDVTAQTPSLSYSAVSASVDLTPEIQVTGQTTTSSYGAVSASVDYTAAIQVTGDSTSYSYSAQGADIDFAGQVQITGQSTAYSYSSVSADVDLQGVINVTGQTPAYSYNAQSGVVRTEDPEITQSFTGFVKSQDFSGALPEQEFRCIIKQSSFSGDIKEISFSGNKKVTEFSGVIQ